MADDTIVDDYVLIRNDVKAVVDDVVERIVAAGPERVGEEATTANRDEVVAVEEVAARDRRPAPVVMAADEKRDGVQPAARANTDAPVTASTSASPPPPPAFKDVAASFARDCDGFIMSVLDDVFGISLSLTNM